MVNNNLLKFSGLCIGSIWLASACVPKTYSSPSKTFYREGESLQQTCETAKYTLDANLPELCSDSSATENTFSCDGTNIEYKKIKRLNITNNDYGAESALYVSASDGEYVLTGKGVKNSLEKIADALYILKDCGR